MIIIHVRIHHCSTITNSGIYKSTSGGTVIQNIDLPVQVAQNIMSNIAL